MDNDNQRPVLTANEEIKALLILLLLKTGTQAKEIETALRLAAGDEEEKESSAVAPVEEPVEPVKSAEYDLTCPFIHAKLRMARPKDILRNEKLAPLKCYAA